MMKYNKSGFTLVELLAVLVILAIILAITIPSISGVIVNATKAAFESDAKLVLQQVEYKKLENPDFDPSDINKSNFKDLLGLSDENYETISITIEDDTPIINIVGTNKWDGWIACGTYRNIKVVQTQSECSNDLIPPVITILGDNPVNINVGETYIEAGATALDNFDGDVTDNIVISITVNPSVPGTYSVTYTVSDSSGNETAVSRTVNVVENFNGPGYIANKGVNGPVLATGMTAIKWSEGAWENTTISDPDWYQYGTTQSTRNWANAVTNDCEIPGDYDTCSMWVWIPRYAYQIASGYHTNSAGTINIKFLKGDTNTASDGSTVATTPTYSDADTQSNYIVHPAFNFGGTQLTGIWVAKFEPSVSDTGSDCYIIPNETNCNVTTLTPKIVPNVYSWRNITVGTSFTVSRNMETNSVYGWGTSGNGIDTHMMKNTEWGAVAYLSKSIYGRTDEIWNNSNNTFKTGCAGSSVSAQNEALCNEYYTVLGVHASTTDNMYGIYDMSGGASERVMGNADNREGSAGIDPATIDNKYIDRYSQSDGVLGYSNGVYGEAVYETSLGATWGGYQWTGSTVGSWYGDTSRMPTNIYPLYCPWFHRGGYYNGGAGAGIFSFSEDDGSATSIRNFRPVLIVHTGL